MADGIQGVNLFTKLTTGGLRKEDVKGTSLETIFDKVDKGGVWDNGVKSEEKSDNILDLNEMLAAANDKDIEVDGDNPIMGFLKSIGIIKEDKNEDGVTRNPDGGYTKTVVGEDGMTHQTTYDAQGRSTKHLKIVDGKTVETSIRKYDENGNSTKTTYDELGRSTYYEVVKNNKIENTAQRAYNEDGSSIKFAYDAFGRITYAEIADANRNVSEYTKCKYTSDDDKSGNMQKFDQDGKLLTTAILDEKGNATVYAEKIYSEDGKTYHWANFYADGTPVEGQEDNEQFIAETAGRWVRYFSEDGSLFETFYDDEGNKGETRDASF